MKDVDINNTVEPQIPEIIITISGPKHSGKTTLAAMITMMLQDRGILKDYSVKGVNKQTQEYAKDLFYRQYELLDLAVPNWYETNKFQVKIIEERSK